MEARPVSTGPSLSIIIATYTRAALLDECLRHLADQQFAAGDEVIVVDNGSTDDTGGVATSHRSRFPVPLRLLYEPTPGKSHALARALSAASSDVLAFLDDDVNVDRQWLDVVRDTMSDPGIALIGGRVVPRWEFGVPAWVRVAPEHHARLGAPLGLLDYPEDVVQLGARTVLGANMAVRREVFDRVGGFATHLGKLRGTLLSGEDHELCRRVQQAGFRAVYVPRAVVHHWVPAERARVGYFVNWFYWSGITNAILDADMPPARRTRTFRGLPLYIVKQAALSTMASCTAFLRGRRDTALHHATDVAFAAGYAAQRWGLRT
jgi:GT2 family glycosyltransferase